MNKQYYIAAASPAIGARIEIPVSHRRMAPHIMQTFDFKHVGVFSGEPLKGNPLAVVMAADDLPAAADDAAGGLSRAHLHAGRELPFAGHPTPGACAVSAGLPPCQPVAVAPRAQRAGGAFAAAVAPGVQGVAAVQVAGMGVGA